MTFIVIQLIRLIVPLTSLEKVVNYNRKVTKKTILLSWLFRALWNKLSFWDKILLIVFVILNNP